MILFGGPVIYFCTPEGTGSVRVLEGGLDVIPVEPTYQSGGSSKGSAD